MLIVLGTMFISEITYAQSGIVPCGRRNDIIEYDDTGAQIVTIDESQDCTICHMFILIDNIIDFLIFNLAPPLFLLMLVIGGGTFIIASGNPQSVTRAKKIISSALIGIAIIYGAYTIIGIFLQSIGLSTWTESIYHNWFNDGFFQVECQVDMK